MKPSSEWLQQPEVDGAGDAILAEGKVTLATIRAYQVAKRLGRAANPTLYGLFHNWRARREAEAEPVTVDVPPEVEAGIRAIFARLSDEGVTACLGAVRAVGGSLDRFAMLRIGDADRRAARAEAETAEVVAIGEKIEEELGAATIRIAELEQALADAQRREDRLAGCLELREADLASALHARNSVDKAAANTAPNAQRDDVGRTIAAEPVGSYGEGEGDCGGIATDETPVVDGGAAGVADHLPDATPAPVTQLPSPSPTTRSMARAATMPADRHRHSSLSLEPRGFLRLSDGNFAGRRKAMMIFFRKENSMAHSIFPPRPDCADDPVARLDAMIAAARTDVDAANAEVDAAINHIEAIEPHPYAHGYTAAGDNAYAGIGPDHFLPLAGLLAQPWAREVAAIETICREQGFDYLLKGFPAAFAITGDDLGADGARLIDARADRFDGDLTGLFARKPGLAVGMVWRLFGYDRRNRDPWIGAFACGEHLSAFIAGTEGVTAATVLGDALAATVKAHRDELSVIGAAELHARAARRNAERQASWDALPEDYRRVGPWRGWAPTKRQRHLMQRIRESAWPAHAGRRPSRHFVRRDHRRRGQPPVRYPRRGEGMMTDSSQNWAARPMTISITDRGQTLGVTNVDQWVEERKQLLRRARDIIKDYDYHPPSLYAQHGTLVSIVTRLAQIKIIFDTFNRVRLSYADANITKIVEYLRDPKTMEGVDD